MSARTRSRKLTSCRAAKPAGSEITAGTSWKATAAIAHPSCNARAFQAPAVSYDRSGGVCSVIGGFVYRGGVFRRSRGTISILIIALAGSRASAIRMEKQPTVAPGRSSTSGTSFRLGGCGGRDLHRGGERKIFRFAGVLIWTHMTVYGSCDPAQRNHFFFLLIAAKFRCSQYPNFFSPKSRAPFLTGSIHQQSGSPRMPSVALATRRALTDTPPCSIKRRAAPFDRRA